VVAGVRGVPGIAGLRSSDCASKRCAADRVRVNPAAYTASTAAELIATRLLATFFLEPLCDISNNCTKTADHFVIWGVAAWRASGAAGMGEQN
jgi:hypothetical protein